MINSKKKVKLFVNDNVKNINVNCYVYKGDDLFFFSQLFFYIL